LQNLLKIMRASVATLEKCTSGAHILGKVGGFAISSTGQGIIRNQAKKEMETIRVYPEERLSCREWITA